MPAKGYSKSKWTGAMCIELIEMFTEGQTREEFCARHSISERTFSTWLDTYPPFFDAYEVAISKAKAYYNRLINNHLIEEHQGPKLNMHAIQLIMRTRFHMPHNRLVKVDGFGTARTVDDKLEALTKSVEAQQLTADEACKLATLLDLAIKVEQHSELRERLEQLEQASKIGVDDEDFKQEVAT